MERLTRSTHTNLARIELHYMHEWANTVKIYCENRNVMARR